jgi:protein phosphatase
MKFYSKTHRGNIRENNEDSIFIGDYYAVVADGMGGHNAGDVASKLIIESIENAFSEKSSEDITPKDLKKAISDANKEVWGNAKRNPERKGMGSTVTLAVFKGSKVFIGQVGDSRAYKYSDANLTQITKDHSYVQQLIDEGHITKKEAIKHPKRNVITRAVGAHIDVEIDFFAVDIKPGDVILLCSDGLISCVSDSEIADILSGDISSASERLVKVALDFGGYDNISVVIAVTEDESI